MKKKSINKPDICSNITTRCKPNSYCSECHHAIYFGNVKANKKMYYFEFSPQHGYTFLTPKTRMVSVWLPSDSHPVWDALKKWQDNKFGGFRIY